MMDEKEAREREVARESRKRKSPPAEVVHEAVRREGEKELSRATRALGWSALAAGLSMGFSLITQAFLMAALPDTPWRDLIVKLGYSTGFLVVILGRQQLFTENTITPVLPLLHNRTLHTLGRVFRLWAIVLTGNLVGAFLFAWVAATAPIFTSEVRSALETVGHASFEGDFTTTYIRAIFAGWLIALIVWMLPFAETGRVFIIIIITYVIGLGHFDHIIAGSVDVLYLVTTGELSFWRYLGSFFLPTLLGNMTGGILLVAILNHAQVVAGEEESDGHAPRPSLRRQGSARNDERAF